MRRLPIAAPALLCAAAVACGDALAPLPVDGPPRVLTYARTGQIAYASSVRMAGDTVVLTRIDYSVSPPAVTESRGVRSADEWRAFWRAVRAAGVRRWPRECINRRVADAGGFAFELAWADARQAGAYYAAAPTALGGCSETDFDAAQRFETAVLTVAGLAPPGTLTP